MEDSVRPFSKIRIGLAVLQLGAWVAAQAPPRPKPTDGVAWSSQGWVFLPFMPGARPVLEDPSHVLQSLSPPPGTAQGNRWTVRDGALYEVAVTPQVDQVNLFRMDLSVEAGKWERVAQFAGLDHGLPPAQVYPLDESKHYLGLNWMGGFTDEGRASFAALFHESDGSMAFDGLVDMPFGTQNATVGTYIPDLDNPKAIGSCQAIHPALDPTLTAHIATDRYAFLVATRAGVIWAFDLRNGQCAKTINLGGLDAKALPSALLVDHFILAAEPDQNGDLIVATRDPGVMTVAEVFQPNLELGKEAIAKSRSDFAEASKAFGGIRWWVVDGKTLDARMSESSRFPQIRGLDYRHVGRFKFLIDSDGQIHTSLDGHWNEFLQKLSEPSGSAPLDAKPRVQPSDKAKAH